MSDNGTIVRQRPPPPGPPSSYPSHSPHPPHHHQHSFSQPSTTVSISEHHSGSVGFDGSDDDDRHGKLNKKLKEYQNEKKRENQVSCSVFFLAVTAVCTFTIACQLAYLMYFFFLPMQSSIRITLDNAADISTRMRTQSVTWFAALDTGSSVILALNGTNLDQMIGNIKSTAEHLAATNVTSVVEHIQDLATSVDTIVHNVVDSGSFQFKIGGFGVSIPINDPSSTQLT